MLIKSYLLEQNISLVKKSTLTLFYGENLGLQNDFFIVLVFGVIDADFGGHFSNGGF